MSPQPESEQWRKNSYGHPVNTRNAWQTALSPPTHHLPSVTSSCTIPFLVEVPAILSTCWVYYSGSLSSEDTSFSPSLLCVSHPKPSLTMGSSEHYGTSSISIPELLVDSCLRWKEKKAEVLGSQQVPRCSCPCAQFLGVALVRRLSLKKKKKST